MQTRHELPMLAGIAGVFRWCEELANLMSGPLLTVGLGIALVDLLTEGKLLASVPALLFTWAISQAVGVDAQLVAMWDKAHIALREKRYGALVGLVILGAVLAYVAWIAAEVFALQESEGLTTHAALVRLGMDSASWLVQRTALSVFLVCLAGWMRYHPPAPDVAADADAERTRLEASLALEPLRAQLRAQQVRGLRGVALSALGRESTDTSTIVEAVSALPERVTVPSRPPTGGGTPVSASKRNTAGRKGTAGASGASGGAKVVPLRSLPAEERIRRAVAQYPTISVRTLAKRANVSQASASKWLQVIAAERSQAVQ